MIRACPRRWMSPVADPEVEAGVELARHALQRMGVSGAELAAIASGLRRSQYGLEPDPGRRGAD